MPLPPRLSLIAVNVRPTLIALMLSLAACGGQNDADADARERGGDAPGNDVGARDVPLPDASPDGTGSPDATDGSGEEVDADASHVGDAVELDAGPDTSDADAEADGSGDSALLPGERPCAEDVLGASVTRTPVDIVIFIDTSGSMQEETRTVESSIVQFTNFIAASQLDYRVVLVAAQDVCFPPPLSTAFGCPDRNGPRYAHARISVGSIDGLERTLQGLELVGDFIRPEAQLHIVAVTDDESAMSAATFLDEARTTYGEVVVHGIVATETDGRICCGPRGCGARVGQVYAELASETGGVLASICEADWLETFETIAATVATSASRPCTYEIPEPPGNDAVYDPERANVFYAEPGGDRVLLPRVDDALQCAGRLAWHYDLPEAPTEIQLCPVACELQSAAVAIELGCDTVKE